MTEKFEFVAAKQNTVSKEEVIADLKRVAEKECVEKVTQKIYSESGEFNCSTVVRKFGTWNNPSAPVNQFKIIR